MRCTVFALATLILCSCPADRSGHDEGPSTTSGGSANGLDGYASDDDPSAGSTAASADTDAWSLWVNGSLRGANVYQQDEGRDDGASRAGFGPPVAVADFMALREAGANLVALSVPGPYHVLQATQWPDASSHLEQLIEAAAAADLYVLISLRTGPGRGEGDITTDGLLNNSVYDDKTHEDGWSTMWQSLATQYAEHPNVVGYDLLVEPHDVGSAAWTTWSQHMIDAVREVDDNTPILVSAPQWGSVDGLASWTPPVDSAGRTAFVVHQYDPYEFTHESNPLTQQQADAALHEIYAGIGDWKQRHSAVVVIGETGFDISASQPTSLGFMQTQFDEAETLGAAWAVWEWMSPDSDWHDFDVRADPDTLALMTQRWSSNTHFPSTQ